MHPPFERIPLFPVRTVLFPGARTRLRVFETRYLDMLRSYLRAGSGFGVILLWEGSEVFQPGLWQEPVLADVGCYATIVDWDEFSQEGLGLTVEGRHKFRLLESSSDSSHLVHGRVAWMPAETGAALPSAYAHLGQVLSQLKRHPDVDGLGMRSGELRADQVTAQLAQLLPVSVAERQKLLALENPSDRLDQLAEILDRLAS